MDIVTWIESHARLLGVPDLAPGARSTRRRASVEPPVHSASWKAWRAAAIGMAANASAESFAASEASQLARKGVFPHRGSELGPRPCWREHHIRLRFARSSRRSMIAPVSTSETRTISTSIPSWRPSPSGSNSPLWGTPCRTGADRHAGGAAPVRRRSPPPLVASVRGAPGERSPTRRARPRLAGLERLRAFGRPARSHRPNRRGRRQFQRRDAARRQPLFYGPPGTGKSEFAKTLGARLGFSVQFCGETNEENAEPNRRERIAALLIANAVGGVARKTIVVVDEADDLSRRPRRR